MNYPEEALAQPRKQFFFDLFTRDISLEDCTLDLIDNSIDSLIFRGNVSISSLVFGRYSAPNTPMPFVDVQCSTNEIRVDDNCGGIDYERAQNEVFCFGHRKGETFGRLGAYGIGLKRAIFKMGDTIHVSSKTMTDGFEVFIDVPKWSSDEQGWSFPLRRTTAARSENSAGTEISITDLHPEVKARVEDGSLVKQLARDVATTYPFFLEKLVRVKVKGETIRPAQVPIAESNDVRAARDSFPHDGVRVTLVATTMPVEERVLDRAGWYILCNGRVVVRANKTDLTGWGISGLLPSFHTKYTRFLGLALFESKNPLLLPWTTTKRNVNRESMVFQKARNRMIAMSRPIVRILNELYPSEPAENEPLKGILDTVRPVELKSVVGGTPRGFEVRHLGKGKVSPNARVVYSVPRTAIEKVRKHINKPQYSNSEIGKYAFTHFLKTEVGD